MRYALSADFKAHVRGPRCGPTHVACGSNAEVGTEKRDVRPTPKSRRGGDRWEGLGDGRTSASL